MEKIGQRAQHPRRLIPAGRKNSGRGVRRRIRPPLLQRPLALALAGVDGALLTQAALCVMPCKRGSSRKWANTANTSSALPDKVPLMPSAASNTNPLTWRASHKACKGFCRSAKSLQSTNG
ncbi:MAG: hypothetical protein EBT70_08370 [Betaproteobacteria bacterium]|nr:hypothetical protein [Betaproteobacteria bacterium]